MLSAAWPLRSSTLMAVGLCLLAAGCSLLSPSRDEISGENSNPSSGGAASGGSAGVAGTGATAGAASGGSAGSSGGAAGSGGSAGASGSGGSAGSAFLFEDDFDAPKAEWKFAGDGTWQQMNGTVVQGDPTASQPIRWVSSLGSATDYVVETRVRPVKSSTGAIQIIFRVNPANPSEFYYCSWHPSTGEQYYGIYSDGFSSAELGAKQASPSSTPNAWITMKVSVKGSTFRCWVPEEPGVDYTISDSTYASGAPGLKSYKLSVEHDYFRVSPN